MVLQPNLCLLPSPPIQSPYSPIRVDRCFAVPWYISVYHWLYYHTSAHFSFLSLINSLATQCSVSVISVSDHMAFVPFGVVYCVTADWPGKPRAKDEAEEGDKKTAFCAQWAPRLWRRFWGLKEDKYNTFSFYLMVTELLLTPAWPTSASFWHAPAHWKEWIEGYLGWKWRRNYHGPNGSRDTPSDGKRMVIRYVDMPKTSLTANLKLLTLWPRRIWPALVIEPCVHINRPCPNLGSPCVQTSAWTLGRHAWREDGMVRGNTETAQHKLIQLQSWVFPDPWHLHGAGGVCREGQGVHSDLEIHTVLFSHEKNKFTTLKLLSR